MSTPKWQTTVDPGLGDQSSLESDEQRKTPGLVLVSAAGQPAFAPCPIGEEEVELGRTHGTLSAYPDGMMSRQHARISFREGRFHITDLGSRNGSALNGQIFTGALRTEAGAVLRLGHSLFLLYEDLRPLCQYGVRVRDQRIEGPSLQQLLRSIEGIAQHSRTLFISGESGSGKEEIAQAFHRSGPQKAGAFIIVNCATLPEGVAERLLFGAQKGAYTGATSASDGYVQAASGGTLFLDEIGDLDLAVQAKLLRVIENSEVTALGATRSRKVSLRICSATHADLRGLVSAGKFRADLYFRLGVPQLRVPPLRERREEIPWLLDKAVQQVAPGLRPRVALIEGCLLRPWPGNVRELLAEGCTAALTALAAGSGAVGLEHLNPTAGHAIEAAAPPELRASTRSHQAAQKKTDPAAAEEDDDPEEEESAQSPVRTEPPSRVQLIAILVECDGNLSAAARMLSMHRTQLRRILIRYGIDPSRLRDRSLLS